MEGRRTIAQPPSLGERTRLWVGLLLAWIALPWLLDAGDDLTTFALHQLYYWPFAYWLGEPFFIPDSEARFFVQPAGRAVVACIYLVLAGAALMLRRRRRKRFQRSA